MKQPWEAHDSFVSTNAPISHCEILPTIAEAVGADASRFGSTIYQFSENELRERTYWLNILDENYPYLPCYTGDKEGASNVLYGYTYIGDFPKLKERIEDGPTIILPVVNTYF